MSGASFLPPQTFVSKPLRPSLARKPGAVVRFPVYWTLQVCSSRCYSTPWQCHSIAYRIKDFQSVCYSHWINIRRSVTRWRDTSVADHTVTQCALIDKGRARDSSRLGHKQTTRAYISVTRGQLRGMRGSVTRNLRDARARDAWWRDLLVVTNGGSIHQNSMSHSRVYCCKSTAIRWKSRLRRRHTTSVWITPHLRDHRTNARRWRDSWLDCQGVFVTQCSVDPDCAGHGCARLFGWRSWTDRRCWNGAGRRGGFYCRRRVSCFAVKLPKFVLGAKRVCGTRPSRTRSQFSFFHRFVFLVYTTQVNSSFRAIWLFPLSRDIKYYSPPGGFQKKNCA